MSAKIKSSPADVKKLTTAEKLGKEDFPPLTPQDSTSIKGLEDRTSVKKPGNTKQQKSAATTLLVDGDKGKKSKVASPVKKERSNQSIESKAESAHATILERPGKQSEVSAPHEGDSSLKQNKQPSHANTSNQIKTDAEKIIEVKPLAAQPTKHAKERRMVDSRGVEVSAEGEIKDPAGALAAVDKPATPPASTGTAAPSQLKGPRTLRVVDGSKNEALTKAVAKAATTASESSNLPSTIGNRTTSRRPSVTSINIPSTPSNEPHSETASISESHADSPSRAGGSSRVKTKSQAKKERRAKKVEDERQPESAASRFSEPEVVQEAIVGRKKKSKKDKPAQARSMRPPVKTSVPTAAEDEDDDESDDEEDIPGAEQTTVDVGEITSESRQEAPHTAERPLSSPTPKERIEGVDVVELLKDLIKSGELDQQTVDLALNPPTPKPLASPGVAQTTIPRLDDEDHRRLDAGVPIAVMSYIPSDDENGTIILSHPYPYSIILPNPEHSIIPMASKAEAELNVRLYHRILADPNTYLRPFLPQLAGLGMNSTATQLDDLSPLELALSYFSNVAEIYPDDVDDLAHAERALAAGPRPEDLRQDANDDLIRLNPASHRWMEDSAREIQAIDLAMGGDHFERARAAALGHGPVRLDSTSDVTVANASAPANLAAFGATAAMTATAPPGTSAAELLAIQHAMRIGGGQRHSGGPESTQDRTVSPVESSEMWEMFRHHLELMSEPLKVQNLSEELQELPTDKAEKRIREAEEYVGRLKREAEAAEKRVIQMVKKHQKQLQPQAKAAVR